MQDWLTGYLLLSTVSSILCILKIILSQKKIYPVIMRIQVIRNIYIQIIQVGKKRRSLSSYRTASLMLFDTYIHHEWGVTLWRSASEMMCSMEPKIRRRGVSRGQETIGYSMSFEFWRLILKTLNRTHSLLERDGERCILIIIMWSSIKREERKGAWSIWVLSSEM